MIEVRIVSFVGDDEQNVRLIRNTVFSSEQNINPDIDFDGKDSSAFHVLIFVDGKSAGTGRMLNDGHIGRVAVLNEFRGKGLGSRIIESLIREAIKNRFVRVYLGSQKHAFIFYTKLGFTPFGKEYIEANIAHISMEKKLL
jgi:predicted GNAT family N-acyltransferase